MNVEGEQGIKLCLIGDPSVGKTCIARKFVENTFDVCEKTTIGGQFFQKSIRIGTSKIDFQIWDTAGQEKYRSLAGLYYRGCAAAILVYDITDELSFRRLVSWVTELRKHANSNVVIALVGNKYDLDKERTIATRCGETYAGTIGALFLETSALTGHNIEKLFKDMGKRLLEVQLEKSQILLNRSTVCLSEQDFEEDRSCCT